MQQSLRRIPVGNFLSQKSRIPFSAQAFRPRSRTRWYSVKEKPQTYRLGSAFLATLLGASVSSALVFASPSAHAEAPSAVTSEANTPKSSHIRLREVHKHGRDAERKWVTRGTRVYDITDWIPGHPGGEVILRAVGGAIDQYWNIFSIHQKQDVYDILETYYIGDIDPLDLEDGAIPTAAIDDPFKADPDRDERLRVLTERPFNAETPSDELRSFVTPNRLFFVRNHMWVPDLRDAEHKVVVELYDGEEKEFEISDLKKLEQTRITATLQCSGNRRQHMSDEFAKASGLPWKVGGISTAEFTGVRLRDILKQVGFPVDHWPAEVKHVHFMGADGYGASIPIDKATDTRGDVILAYEMNGESLPADHGFPIRVVVPGTVAARSVKWVNKISLSDIEATSQWQRRDYKCFGPNEGSNPDWEAARSIQETPVQSAITSVREVCQKRASRPDRELLQSVQLEARSIVVEGYAFSGGGREIVRVDVSADNGQSWHQAELMPAESEGSKSWAWKRWRWVLPQKGAGQCFIVKAVDEAYNSQPDTYGPIYNYKGNLTNAWHRVQYQKDGT
jgi:sulfite oxidase